MEIEWFGSTTFILKNSIGKRILIDPLEAITNKKNYDFDVDIITLSHTPNNKSLKQYITNECTIINDTSSFANEYLTIDGYTSYKDNMNGFKRGENNIYSFNIDGFKLCHLGTVGHILDNKLISKLKNLDFLFIPIGGHFALNGIDAAKLALEITPKYIIPMFYRNMDEYSYLDGPHKFLSHMKNIKKYNTRSIQTSSLYFKNNNTVLLLK